MRRCSQGAELPEDKDVPARYGIFDVQRGFVGAARAIPEYTPVVMNLHPSSVNTTATTSLHPRHTHVALCDCLLDGIVVCSLALNVCIVWLASQPSLGYSCTLRQYT